MTGDLFRPHNLKTKTYIPDSTQASTEEHYSSDERQQTSPPSLTNFCDPLNHISDTRRRSRKKDNLAYYMAGSEVNYVLFVDE